MTIKKLTTKVLVNKEEGDKEESRSHDPNVFYLF